MPITPNTARAAIAAISFIALRAFAPPLAQAQGGVVAEPQQSGTTARLIAVSAVNSKVVWATGERGTFVRTINGGVTWTPGQVAGAESMQFRDVHAVDDHTAYLLSIGKGTDSRIYKTSDAGATWTLQFRNTDPDAFYDCFDFFSSEQAVAIGDAVRGELALLTTSDAGDHWTRVPPRGLPPALAGEGSFASSGTCMITRKNGQAWFGTTKARVLRSTDFGKSWKVSLTPIASSDTTGVTSVSFLDNRIGMAFGGFGATAGDTLIAFSTDGGASWVARPRPPIGPMYAGAYASGAMKPTVVVVGPKGSAYSRDHGLTWSPIDFSNYWGLGFAPDAVAWAVGTNGRITRFSGF